MGFSTSLRAFEKNKIFPLSGIESRANRIPTELPRSHISRKRRTIRKSEVVGLVHRNVDQIRINVSDRSTVRQENDRRTEHEYESELERMRKEAIVAKFEILSTHLHLWTKETHEKTKTSRRPGRESNRAPP